MYGAGGPEVGMMGFVLPIVILLGGLCGLMGAYGDKKGKKNEFSGFDNGYRRDRMNIFAIFLDWGGRD